MRPKFLTHLELFWLFVARPLLLTARLLVLVTRLVDVALIVVANFTDAIVFIATKNGGIRKILTRASLGANVACPLATRSG